MEGITEDEFTQLLGIPAEALGSNDPAPAWVQMLAYAYSGPATPPDGQRDPWDEALTACGPLREACAGALVVDCEQTSIVLGRAKQLAGKGMYAEFMPPCIELDCAIAPRVTEIVPRICGWIVQ